MNADGLNWKRSPREQREAHLNCLHTHTAANGASR